MSAPLASDIVTQIDITIMALITDGASSKSFMGKNYSIIDLDKLKSIRQFYAKLAAETEPTTNSIPVVSNADFSFTNCLDSTRSW